MLTLRLGNEMAIARRILLFIAVNALVLITISIILNLLNVKPYLTSSGLDIESLLIFCLIWGFAGAFISLMMSRLMAKWMMGVQVIDPDTNDANERKLLQIVYSLAQRAGLPANPEVGIYESPEVNAFATGPTKSRALVAVSSGLLQKMNNSEIEGVLSHEIAHVANGDMVTMTLLQGVVNAFVMFFARLLAFVVLRMGKGRDEGSELPSPLLYNIVVFAFEIVFMILGAIVIATYSRFREYRADEGGAKLASREKMIGALKALERCVKIQDPAAQNSNFQAFKISSKESFLHLFASHPPLEKRIARLEAGR